MIEKLQRYLLLALIFIFPIAFATATQDIFFTTKFYLLSFGVLGVLFLSAVNFLIHKKITIDRHELHLPVFLLFITSTLTILFSTPNALSGLTNGMMGALVIVFLALLAVLLRDRKMGAAALRIGSYAAVFLALVTSIFFFNPLAHTELPSALTFLKNPGFTPVGFQLDLALFLGFFLVYGVSRLFSETQVKTKGNPEEQQTVTGLGTTIRTSGPTMAAALIILVGLTFSVSIIVTGKDALGGQKTFNPPYSTSWSTVVETLKSGKTALFGVGFDNYISAFTRAKTPEYNTHEYWNLNFNRSGSTLLHVWTETGLLGVLVFLYMIVLLVKFGLSGDSHHSALFMPLVVYTVSMLLLAPASPIVLFLFFLLLSNVAGVELIRTSGKAFAVKATGDNKEVVMIGIAGVSFVTIGVLVYFLGRVYASEVFFKYGLNGVIANNARAAYEGEQRAIQLAPFVERYRLGFSQLNMLVANAVFRQALESNSAGVEAGSAGTGSNAASATTISERDRTTITQAIQQAIAQAKVPVSLNPAKSVNWENLAVIYTNIIGVAQGADGWAVTAYNQAISADPTNPLLRVSLGGLYYSAKNYKSAQELFIQAVRLKPDYINAYYNLSWALYQDGQIPAATAAMQEVVNRLDHTSADYKKARKDLETFKKKLPQPAQTEQGDRLTLPAGPQATLSPKLELPQEASPQAALISPSATPTLLPTTQLTPSVTPSGGP